MEQVSGIGGVFIYANDPASLAKWYEKHLGIKTTFNEDEGAYYHQFAYRHDDDPKRKSNTTWAILPVKNKPFKQNGGFMINYHVENLDTMIDQLKEMSVKIEKIKTYDYGKFAWITDPAGNRIELYQEKR